MLSALPPDLVLSPGSQTASLPAAVTDQLRNARYWHIYSKQYEANGWPQVTKLVQRSPIEELQIADNDYPPILREIAPISLPNLLSLSLISNRIASLDACLALQAPRLQKLHLSRNCIRRVAPLRRAHLPGLTLLLLNDNPLIDAQTLAEAHFPRLDFLLLENWAESNLICADLGALAKLETGRLRFLGIRSVERIGQAKQVRQLRARFPGL